VSHAGRKRLELEHDGPMPTDAASWADFTGSFAKLLAAEVADADRFACDFTTSTPADRVAGQIVLLDAYSPYFSLWLIFVCGIPSITLTGTVDDWRKIRSRVDGLAGFGLDRWRRSLAPILDQFVRGSAGDVDTAFWQRIYSPRDAYGGDVITGWAARLYPYLKGDAFDEPNPMLDLPLDQPRDTADPPGIPSSSVPAVLSRVTVNLVGGPLPAVELRGGLVAVAQDEDGALRPVAGWHLARAEVRIDDVIDRMERDHRVTPPESQPVFNASADLAALYRRIGSATLFDGAWRLRRHDEHTTWERAGLREDVLQVIDLPDGRFVGAVADHETQTTLWLTARAGDDPGDVPTYGTSLAALLSAALETGGDLGRLETGRLIDLDRQNRFIPGN
jgi:hypothetical protein